MTPYSIEIRLGQIRITDSCSACNPPVLNNPERRHLHRKIVELASSVLIAEGLQVRVAAWASQQREAARRRVLLIVLFCAVEPPPKLFWFQLGSNEGLKNQQFFGLSGADSTVLKFVNSRMLYR